MLKKMLKASPWLKSEIYRNSLKYCFRIGECAIQRKDARQRFKMSPK